MMQRGAALIALAADALGLVAAILWLPALARQFARLTFANSAYLGGFFLLFLLAIDVFRRLRPAPWLRDRRLLFLAGLFAFVLSTAVAYSVGFLDSVAHMNREVLDEPSAAIYLLLSPASWLGLSLIYVLLLTTESEARPWQPLRAFLALVAANAIAIALAAVARAFWLRLDPANGGLPILATLALALLLFAPPRLIYLGKEEAARPPALLAWLSLFLFLGYLSWAAVLR